MTALIKTAQLLLSLSLLVVFHEVGHFLWSKLFKTRVDKFYMFFNPKFSLLRIKRVDGKLRVRFFAPNVEDPIVELRDEEGNVKKDDKGNALYRPMTDEERAALPKGDWRRDPDNTEFGIGWVPFGGYCRITGMVDETQSASNLASTPQPYEFRTKKSWQRLLIMIGGVVNNLILAFFVYSMVLYAWGDEYRPISGSKYGMEFNDYAKEIGFQDHDELLRTDKTTFTRFDADMLRAIAAADEVTVLRDGREVAISIPDDLTLLNLNRDGMPFISFYMPMEIDSVAPEMGAARAGLRKGDRIVSINGVETDTWNRFRGVLATLAEREKGGEIINHDLPIAFLRDGSLDTLLVSASSSFQIGIFSPEPPFEWKTDRYGFWASIPAGIRYGWNTLRGYVSDFKYVFTREGAKSLGGFGTIGSIFPATWDWHAFWMMTAFLSIILAFMNIIPIPGLDGGHVLFLLWEVITGKKVSDKVLEKAEWVGFILLMALMVYANANDVVRFLF